MIYLAWFGEKTLKSGLYFYKNSPLVKIISSSHRSFSSIQDLVHGFITRLKKVFFDALQLLKSPTTYDITESNEFWYSFQDFAEKLWNSDSNLGEWSSWKRLQSHNYRSFSQHKILFTALLLDYNKVFFSVP